MEEFLKPAKILKQLDLKEDMTAADFGSGSGGWALPLAQILKKGKVYAIDILEEPLSVLKSRAEAAKILNIVQIRTDLEKGSQIKDDHADLVLLTNVLFQMKDQKQIIKEATRIAKQRGLIFAVDWKKEASLIPKDGRISIEEVKKIAKGANLEFLRELEAGKFHYGLLFEKP